MHPPTQEQIDDAERQDGEDDAGANGRSPEKLSSTLV